MPRHILKQVPNALSVNNNIVFTSAEAMVINSLVSGVFSGKNKTSALVKNPFFSRNSFRNICKFIFVWKVSGKTFPRNFFLRGKQKSRITNHARPTLCKDFSSETLTGTRYIIFRVMFTCQTLLKHKYTDNATGIVFFIVLFFARAEPNFHSAIPSTQPTRNLWCLFAKSCWKFNTRTMLWISFLYCV